MQILEGKFIDSAQSQRRFAVVVSRFNSLVTERLVEGALDCLRRHGVEDENIVLTRVPGAFELPLICQKLADTGKFSAIIALGAVIRGSTPHFDFVANECSKGLAQAMMSSGIPIAFGVLTTNTIEQALERSGVKAGNKGYDAAATALEMTSLDTVIKDFASDRSQPRTTIC